MSEWWTYSLSNFLMFSPQVYYRLFENSNRAWWPLPLLAFALGVGLLVLMLTRRATGGRVVALVLAGAWLSSGWIFLAQAYAPIHLGGDAFAAAFLLQALMLLWLGVLRGSMTLEWHRGALEPAGVLLFAIALIGWPLLAPYLGRGWWGAEVFGMAPDPTAVATLGILLVCARPPWPLVPIPVLWCAFSGATLWSMGSPEALLAPALALLGMVLVVAKRGSNRMA